MNPSKNEGSLRDMMLPLKEARLPLRKGQLHQREEMAMSSRPMCFAAEMSQVKDVTGQNCLAILVWMWKKIIEKCWPRWKMRGVDTTKVIMVDNMKLQRDVFCLKIIFY